MLDLFLLGKCHGIIYSLLLLLGMQTQHLFSEKTCSCACMCRLPSSFSSKGSVFLCSTHHIAELKKALGLLNSLLSSYQTVCFSARKDMYRFMNTTFQTESKKKKKLATSLSQPGLIYCISSYCLFKYSNKRVYQLNECQKYQLLKYYFHFSKTEFHLRTSNFRLETSLLF